jgi:hypothetical protein
VVVLALPDQPLSATKVQTAVLVFLIQLPAQQHTTPVAVAVLEPTTAEVSAVLED